MSLFPHPASGRALPVLGAALAVLLALVPFPAAAMEPVPLEVTVNAKPTGPHTVYLTAADRVYVSAADLDAFGVVGVSPTAFERIGDVPYLLLDNLFPWVRYAVDRAAGTVSITVHPSYLRTSRVDAAPAAREDALHPSRASAFLNYAAVYSGDDAAGFGSLDVPVEAGVRAGPALAFFSGLYADDGPNAEFVRYLSYLAWDDPRHLRQWTAGDLSAVSGELGGAVRLGGIGVSRNYGLSPYLLRFPDHSVRGTLNTPGEVSVLVNGMRVWRGQLPAGHFEISGLADAVGAGEAELVVVDAFGRESREAAPFYTAPRLLEAGRTAYSYNFGSRRENFGVRSAAYGSWAFSGRHELGLANVANLGLAAEADRDGAAGGPLLRARLGLLGEVEGAWSTSRRDTLDGHAQWWAYRYRGRVLGVRLDTRRYSRNYANLEMTPLEDRPRYAHRAAVGLALHGLGALTFGYGEAKDHSGPRTLRRSVRYAVPLTRRVFLSVLAARTHTTGDVDEVFASLHVDLDGRHAARYGFEPTDNGTANRLAVTRNPPLGPGVGYHLEKEWFNPKTGYGREGDTVSLDWRARYGVVRGWTWEDTWTGTRFYRAGLAGSVVAGPDGPLPARPVRDAYAVVRAGNVEGVRVRYAHQPMGRTGRSGLLVVPELVPYVDNPLSIDAATVPLDHRVGETAHTAAVPAGGGVEVPFAVRPLRAVRGHLTRAAGKGARPVAEARLTLGEGEAAVSAVTGVDGLFYLEDLGSGVYEGAARVDGGRCRFTLEVPEGAGPVADLGEVRCELD